jgi:hypothetical protein
MAQRKKKPRTGKRHPLLMYRRVWDRIWLASSSFGILLLILWWQAGSGKIPIIRTADNIWILMGGAVALGLGFFGFLARNMSFVKPYNTYLRLATPFLRMNISYRRLRSVRPVHIAQLFPPKEQSWAGQQFLAPFYGQTAVSIELNDYPISPRLLRIFLPTQIFIPQGTGFVLIVNDWMKLSAELDSFRGAWEERQRSKSRRRVNFLQTPR